MLAEQIRREFYDKLETAPLEKGEVRNDFILFDILDEYEAMPICDTNDNGTEKMLWHIEDDSYILCYWKDFQTIHNMEIRALTKEEAQQEFPGMT